MSLCYSVPVSDAYVSVLSVVVFFGVNFSFFHMFSFLKICRSMKYVLLASVMPICAISHQIEGYSSVGFKTNTDIVTQLLHQPLHIYKIYKIYTLKH